MWNRLRTKGVVISRESVRLALRFLDEEGVQIRHRRRLRRRSYANPGPNFCWHADGYDKLKRFGFAIHGCIDGFSRKVLWLHVGPTNNHPQVTALYFVRTMLELKKMPTLLRCDRGTENVHLEKIQKFLRKDGTDAFSGMNSFLYGRSTANQRIESWWSVLRKQLANFWINRFKDMQEIGILNIDDPVHVECLRFCFMALLQDELNRQMLEWNVHCIQSRKKHGLLGGKPDKMFFLPEQFNAQSYECPVEESVLCELEMELSLDEGDPHVVQPDFVKLVTALIPTWKEPSSFDEGLQLFRDVTLAIAMFEQNH